MSDSTAAARSRRLLVLLAALLGLCIAALAFGLWARGRTPDAQREVLRCGDLTLTNQDLAYYYWSEYYFLINEGGSSLDPDTDPAAQPVDDTRTWQDTLLDRALVTAQDTLANVLAAQDTGFALPESYETSLAQVMDDLSSYAAALGFTDDAGAADLTAYIFSGFHGLDGKIQMVLPGSAEDHCIDLRHGKNLFIVLCGQRTGTACLLDGLCSLLAAVLIDIADCCKFHILMMYKNILQKAEATASQTNHAQSHFFSHNKNPPIFSRCELL